jgi:hypothetical protein
MADDACFLDETVQVVRDIARFAPEVLFLKIHIGHDEVHDDIPLAWSMRDVVGFTRLRSLDITLASGLGTWSLDLTDMNHFTDLEDLALRVYGDVENTTHGDRVDLPLLKRLVLEYPNSTLTTTEAIEEYVHAFGNVGPLDVVDITIDDNPKFIDAFLKTPACSMCRDVSIGPNTPFSDSTTFPKTMRRLRCGWLPAAGFIGARVEVLTARDFVYDYLRYSGCYHHAHDFYTDADCPDPYTETDTDTDTDLEPPGMTSVKLRSAWSIHF